MQDDTALQVLAAAAVLGRRVDGRLLTAMVQLEEESGGRRPRPPVDTVVGQVVHLHHTGVTVVLTLDPAG